MVTVGQKIWFLNSIDDSVLELTVEKVGRVYVIAGEQKLMFVDLNTRWFEEEVKALILSYNNMSRVSTVLTKRLDMTSVRIKELEEIAAISQQEISADKVAV